MGRCAFYGIGIRMRSLSRVSPSFTSQVVCLIRTEFPDLTGALASACWREGLLTDYFS